MSEIARSESMYRRRTHLADPSNGRIAKADRGGSGNLDRRLLLVRSELSALVNQLDQIFSKALEHHNMKSITANEDIESLCRLLSGMNSSLEPWVLRLSRAQTAGTPAVQFSKSLGRFLASTHRDRISSPSTSDETKHGVMISPSPLVAWRADGRAPEIREAFDGRNPCCNGKESNNPAFFNSSPQDFKLRSEVSSSHLSEEGVSNAALSLKNHKAVVPPSSHNWTNKRTDYDDDEEELEWFLSPPKTCTLMVPDYVSKNPSILQKKSSKIPVSMEVAGALSLHNGSKIPESLKGSNKQGIHDLQLGDSTNKREFNEPLEWFLSPPKTCILMEPSEGKMSPTPSVIDDTVLRSRRAGESTLKKELWTKFESVPMGGLSYKDSASQKVAKKGFMDMLEEALF